MKYIIQRSITSVMAAALSVCALAACSSEADVVDEVIPTDTSVTTTSTAVSTTTTATTESTTTNKPVTDTDTEQGTNEPEQPTTPDTEPDTPAGDRIWNDKPLADTDVVNSDGTYSVHEYTTGYVCADGVALAENEIKYLIENGKVANPSQIPYSEITVDNAAEAFPYLGEYLGYFPEYIEIEPGMSIEKIKEVITWNFLGNSPRDYYNAYIDGTPRYSFSSKEEHDAYLAERAAERAEADRKEQEAADAWERYQNTGEDATKDPSADEVMNLW